MTQMGHLMTTGKCAMVEVTDGDGAVVNFDSTEQFNAYWFAHSMKDLGNKTDEIWPVGGVSASVYKKGSTYTAIAWNPTEDDMVFEFTNGTKIVGSATIASKSLVRFDPLAKDIVQVSTPEFSLASDTYEDTQYLKITTATEGADIHYTTDGSNPTENSPVYTERIPVSSTTTIKAVAIKDGYIDSKIEAVTITINGSSITTGANIALGKKRQLHPKMEEILHKILQMEMPRHAGKLYRRMAHITKKTGAL